MTDDGELLRVCSLLLLSLLLLLLLLHLFDLLLTLLHFPQNLLRRAGWCARTIARRRVRGLLRFRWWWCSLFGIGAAVIGAVA